MKKLKLMLTTLSILLALSGVFAPTQIVRADGGPQGTADSQRTSSTSSDQDSALAFWLWLFHLLGLIA